MKRIILAAICIVPSISNSMEISLDSNPSTGFSWQFECKPKNGASIEAIKNTSSNNIVSPIEGAPIKQNFTITKTSTKPVTCTFKYTRSWENVSPAKQFSIKL